MKKNPHYLVICLCYAFLIKNRMSKAFEKERLQTVQENRAYISGVSFIILYLLFYFWSVWSVEWMCVV